MREDPLYLQVANALRGEILAGQWPPGAQLPSESRAEARFGVSRVTVRRAFAQLANEGLVTPTSGRGTFVRSASTFTYYASRSEESGRRAAAAADAYMTDVADAGRTPSQTFEMRIVTAPQWVVQLLDIDEEAAAVLRRCWRRIDGQPWSLQDSYYPMWLADLAPELMAPGDITRGTTRMLQEHGVDQVGFVDELVGRMPRPDEEHWFTTGPGIPVMVQVRTAYTADRPVRVTETVFPADRNRIAYEIGDLSALYEDRDHS